MGPIESYLSIHGASGSATRRKAEVGNAAHLGPSMPGVVSAVAVSAGQSVKAGDVLFSIEAMKMETALHAERDGIIAEMLVCAGDQIASGLELALGISLSKVHVVRGLIHAS
jgi:pyruvate carboxylase